MDHWEQLAGLPLVVESLAYGRLDGPGFGQAHSSRPRAGRVWLQ